MEALLRDHDGGQSRPRQVLKLVLVLAGLALVAYIVTISFINSHSVEVSDNEITLVMAFLIQRLVGN